MPDKKEKSRQATVKPESPNNGGENNGNANENTDGELVFNTGMTGHNSTAPFALIPGFSQAQMFDLMIMIAVTMNIRFEQRFGNFDTNRQQNSPFPNTQDYQPHQEQQSLMPDQNLSHTTDSSHHTNPSQLRAEEVGYFDPEYQPEHGQQEPIINADKHVYYRDVYVFVDRPKDLATRYNIIHVIALYLRGSALMWYSMELTDLERTGLRTADPALWYTTLINRFKVRTATALSQLIGQTYSLHDIKHTFSRAFIQQMLHLIKSIEFHIIYNQLTLFWNQFAVNLRRDLPEPQLYTTIDQFLEQMDSKTPI